MAKIVELHEALNKSELPRDKGFVITELLIDSTRYARYEIISYANVKDIYPSQEGVTFQSDGKKLYILFEPLNYSAKHLEPIHRDEAHKIPLRFNELEICSTARQERIMIAKKPIMTYTAFTVANPSGLNTSYIVYSDESSARTILGFFEQSFWKTLNTTHKDAKTACEVLSKPLQALMVPEGL